MNRRVFMFGSASMVASFVATAAHAQDDHAGGVSELPENALALAQRKLWSKNQERSAESVPAWNCVVVVYRDRESATQSYDHAVRSYIDNLTLGDSEPSISTPEDRSENRRHAYLLQLLDASASLNVFLAQRDRLLHLWVVAIAADQMVQMDHEFAFREASKAALDFNDDQPYYGKEVLFELLPDPANLPSYLELEYSSDEDLYIQDY